MFCCRNCTKSKLGMNIIEKIRKLAKGEYPGTLVWLDRSTADCDQTEVGSIGELSALAESHERLLSAAKAVIDTNIVGLGVNEWMDGGKFESELLDAIEQAQKLFQ